MKSMRLTSLAKRERGVIINTNENWIPFFKNIPVIKIKWYKQINLQGHSSFDCLSRRDIQTTRKLYNARTKEMYMYMHEVKFDSHQYM